MFVAIRNSPKMNISSLSAQPHDDGKSAEVSKSITHFCSFIEKQCCSILPKRTLRRAFVSLYSSFIIQYDTK